LHFQLKNNLGINFIYFLEKKSNNLILSQVNFPDSSTMVQNVKFIDKSILNNNIIDIDKLEEQKKYLKENDLKILNNTSNDIDKSKSKIADMSNQNSLRDVNVNKTLNISNQNSNKEKSNLSKKSRDNINHTRSNSLVSNNFNHISRNEIPMDEIPVSHKYFIPKYYNLCERDKQKYLHIYNNKTLREEKYNNNSIYNFKKIMDLERKYCPEIFVYEQNQDYPHPCVRGERGFKQYSYRALDYQIKNRNFLEKELFDFSEKKDSIGDITNKTTKNDNKKNYILDLTQNKNVSFRETIQKKNIINQNNGTNGEFNEYGKNLDIILHPENIYKTKGSVNFNNLDYCHEMNTSDYFNIEQMMNYSKNNKLSYLNKINKNSKMTNLNNITKSSESSNIFDNDNIFLNDKNNKFLQNKNIPTYNEHFVKYVLKKNVKSNFRKIVKISKKEIKNKDSKDIRKIIGIDNNSNMINLSKNKKDEKITISDLPIKNSYLNDQLKTNSENNIPLEIKYLIKNKIISNNDFDV